MDEPASHHDGQRDRCWITISSWEQVDKLHQPLPLDGAKATGQVIDPLTRYPPRDTV